MEILKLHPFLEEHEKHYLETLLNMNDWQMMKTAKAAGISRKCLWQKMKKHGIRREAKPKLKLN